METGLSVYAAKGRNAMVPVPETSPSGLELR